MRQVFFECDKYCFKQESLVESLENMTVIGYFYLLVSMLRNQHPLNQYHLQYTKLSFTKQILRSRLNKVSSK